MVEKGDEYPPHQRIILITSAQSLGTELRGLTDIFWIYDVIHDTSQMNVDRRPAHSPRPFVGLSSSLMTRDTGDGRNHRGIWSPVLPLLTIIETARI